MYNPSIFSRNVTGQKSQLAKRFVDTACKWNCHKDVACTVLVHMTFRRGTRARTLDEVYVVEEVWWLNEEVWWLNLRRCGGSMVAH
jgi:hypothetical protein